MASRQITTPEPWSAEPGRLVHHLVEEWAARAPGATAIVSGERFITYGRLNAAANRLARVLKTRGVETDSIVAVALRPSPELVVALLATLKAGGAYLPLDSGYPRERLELMLADAAPKCALATSTVAAELGLDPESTVLLEDGLVEDGLAEDGLAEEGDASNLRICGPESAAAYVMYTSGSTGKPKGVVIDHASVVALVTLDARTAVGPGEVVVQFAPIAFDAATFELWAPLCSGGTVAIVSSNHASISELGGQLRRLRPDWLFLTSALFHLLVEHDPDALAAVGHVLTGGDVLSPRHVVEAATRPRDALYAAYGPTEATTFTSFHHVAADSAYQRVPLGTPLAGMQMHIVDGDLCEVKQGDSGEICISGAGIARGYLGQPALTAARFVPDPLARIAGQRLYRTGDLGRRLADGDIEFLGRMDRQVKVRGFRVELGEIEAALARSPGVAASAVVAVESRGTGHKRLVAYVERQSTATLTASDLRAWLAGVLPSYMLPATYVVLDRLPLDPNGKIARKELPYPWRRRGAELTDDERPRTEVERLLSTIWADALSLDEIGTADDFFDSGGDSLLSVDVLAELRVNGLVVEARDLFRNPTIGGLAPFVRRASDNGAEGRAAT